MNKIEKLIEKYHIGIHDRDEFKNDVGKYALHILEKAVKYGKNKYFNENEPESAWDHGYRQGLIELMDEIKTLTEQE